MKKILLSLAILLVTSFYQKNIAQIISLTQFATGFTKPVDIKNCHDSRLFIVEQNGYIYILDSLGVKNTAPFLNIDSRVGSSGNEQGLLGLAFSPNYATDGYFYVDYTNNSGNTRISRFSRDTTNPDLGDPNSENILLTIYQPYSNHNGGHVSFGPDGYLYIGMGDGGSGGDPGNRAQNKDSLLGKILRIDVSGGGAYSIPPTNPFVGVTGRDEIWAYGVRNPWRWSFDRITGDLWIGDVGQNAYEEIDFQPASSAGGENYGWRCYEGNHAYNTSGCAAQSTYKSPVYEFTHSVSCSVTGGYIYRGAQHADLWGKYFFTDYCSSILQTLWDSSGTYVHSNIGTYSSYDMSSFGEDQYGEIYIASLSTGQILRIDDTGCMPKAFLAFSDTLSICGDSTVLSTPAGAGMIYQWFENGTLIPTATESKLTVHASGNFYVVATNSSFCSDTSSTVSVFINPVPVATMSNLDTAYCINGGVVATITGNPPGGIFSGAGVTGNQLNTNGLTIGIEQITYTYTDSAGCLAAASLDVNMKDCTGINEMINENMISVSPNPSHADFTIKFSLPRPQTTTVKVIDRLGKIYYEKNLGLINGSRSMKIKMENVSAGIYFVTLVSEYGVAAKKITIE